MSRGETVAIFVTFAGIAIVIFTVWVAGGGRKK